MKRSARLAMACLLSVGLIQAEMFRDVRYLYKAEGEDKGQEVIGKLSIDATQIEFTSVPPKKRNKKHPQPDVAVKFQPASITSALYERASRPRYISALLIAWPLIFTKGKKHFLTIQYRAYSGVGGYVIFHMDKSNFRAILGAVEASTGKKIERSEEH